MEPSDQQVQDEASIITAKVLNRIDEYFGEALESLGMSADVAAVAQHDFDVMPLHDHLLEKMREIVFG